MEPLQELARRAIALQVVTDPQFGGAAVDGDDLVAAAAEGLPMLPMVSLAKREEEIFLIGRPDGLRLPRRSPSLRLLQRARDASPDAVFIFVPSGQGGTFMKQYTERGLDKAGIKLVGEERFARSDTSVTAQVLKILLAGPDAVFIGGSGTPAALPQKAFTLKSISFICRAIRVASIR